MCHFVIRNIEFVITKPVKKKLDYERCISAVGRGVHDQIIRDRDTRPALVERDARRRQSLVCST